MFARAAEALLGRASNPGGTAAECVVRVCQHFSRRTGQPTARPSAAPNANATWAPTAAQTVPSDDECAPYNVTTNGTTRLVSPCSGKRKSSHTMLGGSGGLPGVRAANLAVAVVAFFALCCCCCCLSAGLRYRERTRKGGSRVAPSHLSLAEGEKGECGRCYDWFFALFQNLCWDFCGVTLTRRMSRIEYLATKYNDFGGAMLKVFTDLKIHGDDRRLTSRVIDLEFLVFCVRLVETGVEAL